MGNLQLRLASTGDATAHRTTARLEKRIAGLPSPERADSLFLAESLRHKLSRQHEPPEAYSLTWFEQVERQRHDRQAPWLPQLLEFSRHEGESLLGLGNGLGSDWLQYAKHGAKVTICCADPEQAGLVRRNFELRGLSARFRPVGSGALPVDDNSFDLVCSHGLPAGREKETVAEIYRVLRPGGKMLGVLPARRNSEYWQTVLLPWHRLFAPKPTFAPTRFTAAEIRQQFDYFTSHRIHKRHLKRHELPHVLRGLPESFGERLMGRFLIWKALKPLRPTLHLGNAA